MRGSTVSACEKVIASACEKVITSAHEKAIASVCEKVIASVDPGGLMINAERINSQLSHENSKDLTYFCCMLVLKLFTLLFTIDTERINSLFHMWKGDLTYFSCMLVKTVYITVYNWCREDQQSLHVKRQLPLHVKRWLPLHMKRWLPLLILGVGGIDDQCREDQQSTFTWKIQKI